MFKYIQYGLAAMFFGSFMFKADFSITFPVTLTLFPQRPSAWAISELRMPVMFAQIASSPLMKMSGINFALTWTETDYLGMGNHLVPSSYNL